MTKSELFKKAHRYTKKTIQSGENYQVNFGQWLKVLNAHQKTLETLDLNAILNIAKSGNAKELLSNSMFQEVAQAGVSYKGRIQTINFNEFLALDISDYDANEFLTDIASSISKELAGRNGDFTYNATSEFRTALKRLSVRTAGQNLLTK